MLILRCLDHWKEIALTPVVDYKMVSSSFRSVMCAPCNVTVWKSRVSFVESLESGLGHVTSVNGTLTNMV